MNPPNASSRSNSSLNSSLRPRTRRLISGLDEEGFPEGSGSNPTSRSASPRDSPSRGSSRIAQFQSNSSPAKQRNPGPLSGAWSNSLLALQGLASDVLGGSDNNGRGATMRRQRSAGAPWQSTAITSTPAAWGPSGMEHDQIGAGSREQRESLVKEAKRKDLLAANGHSLPDSTGRFKRRTSEDLGYASISPGESEGDALVYIHRVRPGDTLAGLTIRYNCQPAVLRKANRMWPNDPIQARETIVLPVDACGVKGRPVPSPQDEVEEDDLIGDETMTMHESPTTSKSSPINGWHKDPLPSTKTSLPEHRPPSSSASSRIDAEPPWKHDSWVLLSNDTQPTEIARLPRRTLGFFPRARRKSNTFSDIGTSRNTSFDILRSHPPSPSAQSPLKASPALRPALSSRPSISSSRTRSASNNMASFLHGPGGVGSLGSGSRAPGPAPDRLNALLGPHLPSVAPPLHQTVFTPWAPGLLHDDLISFGSGTAATPLDATGSGGGSGGASGGAGIDLQDVGGAIEGWMRKMAKRASSALEANSTGAGAASSKGGNPGVQAMGLGGGMGDLIELVDAFEIGDGGEARAGDMPSVLVGVGSGGTGTETSGRSEGDGRGRRRIRESSAKGGKSD